MFVCFVSITNHANRGLKTAFLYFYVVDLQIAQLLIYWKSFDTYSDRLFLSPTTFDENRTQ